MSAVKEQREKDKAEDKRSFEMMFQQKTESVEQLWTAKMETQKHVTDSEVNKVKKEMEKTHSKEVEDMKAQHHKEMIRLNDECATRLQKMVDEHTQKTAASLSTRDEYMKQMDGENNLVLSEMRFKREQAVGDHAEEIADLQDQIAQMRASHTIAVEAIAQDHSNKVTQLEAEHDNKVTQLEVEHELCLKAVQDKQKTCTKALVDATEIVAKRDADKIRALNSQHRQKIEDMEQKFNATLRAANEEQAILRRQFDEFLDDYDGGD